MRKKYNVAPERKSVQEQALLIEDAEVQILRICKDTALYRYTRQRFVDAVRGVIKRLQKELDNEDLKARIAPALESYAAKTLEREVRLIREKALFYAAVILALDGPERRKAKRLNDTVIKQEYSAEFKSAPAFVSYSEEAKRTLFNSYDTRLPLGIYHKRYMDSVRTTLNELIAADAKEDYSTNVSIRNIAEMTVRYDYQLERIAELKEAGEDLVYIRAHANCSKRCEKYQVGGSYHPSGLYSLSGRRGVTAEGVKYIPLTEATDNEKDRYTTRAGKTYQNGCITGFNCRHELVPYRPNLKMREIPAEAVERRRAIEQRQRAYEREIRGYKRLYVQLKGIDPKEAKKAYRAAKKSNQRYISFSEKNDVAYYPERTRILDDEE